MGRRGSMKAAVEVFIPTSEERPHFEYLKAIHARKRPGKRSDEKPVEPSRKELLKDQMIHLFVRLGGLTRIGQIRGKEPIKERSDALSDAVHDAELPTIKLGFLLIGLISDLLEELQFASKELDLLQLHSSGSNGRRPPSCDYVEEFFPPLSSQGIQIESVRSIGESPSAPELAKSGIVGLVSMREKSFKASRRKED
ncbi:hypothetical protein HAX54_044599 [Datura stramonium]|uniref:Uncharacterized protein n=1 Tax=Datura stramonium TaxID=4076 RepID=A0ABS8WEU4_DATST|nr:hypothetical protein [Datura stramonium]